MFHLSFFTSRANRGIGLETVRQLLESPINLVIATTRDVDNSVELQGLKAGAKGELHIIILDVSSTSSIDAVKQTVQDILGDKGLDYLINNAGIVRRALTVWRVTLVLIH